jgi:hypothetical protein
MPGLFSRPLVACALLVCVSCGTSVSYVALNRPPRALSPRPPESVRLYSSDRPVGPYVDVGLLEAVQDSGLSAHETRDIIAALRKRAGQLGCDGLVIGGISSHTGVAETVLLDAPLDRKGVYGTCVVYTVAKSEVSEDPPPGLSARSRAGPAR